ncbi:MAG TPA: group I intron-associated PD-(D/E)XK endonuclease [Candidatus Limnocylindria bacterium]
MSDRSAKTWQETTGRGDETELAVALALVRAGKRLLRPLSSATRYDLLVDNEDGTFSRIQCKTGRLRGGTVEFRLYSISGHNTRQNGYRGQVDAFGVYCPDTAETYLVPLTALRACEAIARLRRTPARNGQRRRVRSAAEYVIGGPDQRLRLPIPDQ